MNAKKWITQWVIIILIFSAIVGGFNYVIDPYGIYETKYFTFEKIKQENKISLAKIIKVRKIKPRSIVLGTSRAEFGYDPTHKYFPKPSYNFATSGSSMYENRLKLEHALKQGNLEKVLLVVDYRLFTNKTQKSIPEFETYFGNKSIYTYMFSMDTLKDSLSTIKGTSDYFALILENGQRDHDQNWKKISKFGGHLVSMRKFESDYYKEYSSDYHYKDTGNASFPDFEAIIKLCYENNIKLDIIMGPNHIRQWEAFDYYLGYNNWLKWKKDVVVAVNKISIQHGKEPFRIMDFSVYHELTAEKVPEIAKSKMKYHWDASHYKHELGEIVLDRLLGESEFKDFGLELNIDNIDAHIEQLRQDRYKFIDVKQYREGFEKYLKSHNS